jgi:phage shock protein PspC (stress-responsive transcriptional regulator)
MKKTIAVNLGGLVFNIDEDAYDVLKNYLQSIEGHFADIHEKKEVMDDIESRIAELLQERMSNEKQVVNLRDVQEIIDILGNPEEIGESAHEETGRGQDYGSGRGGRSSGYRRIYRDPDNRMVGGVSAGLGAYFNIDPLIFRVIFVALTLVGGSGLIIYIILWIVIPEARTRAQKMQMRGEPVTIENIGKTVKEEFENVKNNFKRK